MMSNPGYALVLQEDKLLLLPKKNGSLLTPVTESHSLLSCQVPLPQDPTATLCAMWGAVCLFHLHLQTSYAFWFFSCHVAVS